MCIHLHTSMHVCMYDCLRSERESASPPQLKGVRVIDACARVCVLTAVVHAHESGKKKNRYVHTHYFLKNKYGCAFSERKGKEISTHACTCTYACMTPPQINRISRCATVHYMCVCVCCYYFANPSTVFVCLSVHVRPCVLVRVHKCWGVMHVQQTFDHDVHQTAVKYTHGREKANKQDLYTHTHTEWMHVVCMIVWGENKLLRASRCSPLFFVSPHSWLWH